ncbi:hypothetical protein FE391_46840, partial [Nonomuraea sp. KC401]
MLALAFVAGFLLVRARSRVGVGRAVVRSGEAVGVGFLGVAVGLAVRVGGFFRFWVFVPLGVGVCSEDGFTVGMVAPG